VNRKRLITSLVLVTFAAGIGAGATTASRPLGQTFHSRIEGIAVRYPSSWFLTPGLRSVVTDPSVCFALAADGDSGVQVKVVEYLPPLLTANGLSAYQPRPSHFLLSKLRRSDNDWTTGKVMSFREQGRVFYGGVVLPARTPISLRHTIEAVLDSFQA
jgi:hypothetical protein